MNKKILSVVILSVTFLSIASFANADICSMLDMVKQQLLLIGGTLVIVGWVVAGILFLTSGGGSRMEVAKKAMWAALIGTILVIVALTSYSLINAVLGNPGNGGACDGGSASGSSY